MATTTNYGWTTPDDTALVKDGASAIRSLGTAVDTTTKALNPSTTLGDIEYRSSTANTNTRLGIGSTGQVLTVAGGVPSWATPAGGGKVLQVVSAVYTTASTNTTETYADTGLTASITPSSTSSKILVFINQGTLSDRASGSCGNHLQILRGATVVHENTRSGGIAAGGASSTSLNTQQILIYLDSPATTSSTTYKTQGRLNTATASSVVVFQENSRPSTITLMEIGA